MGNVQQGLLETVLRSDVPFVQWQVSACGFCYLAEISVEFIVTGLGL